MQMTMGTRNYGREEAHNARGAECAEERRKHQVKQAGACDAQACVGQKFGLAVGGDGSVARDERERRAQKRWHLALGQNMEEQRAQTGEQQRVAYRKAREYRHQNGGAEHREHVLDAQHKHARLAKGGRVVNGGWGFGLRSGAGDIAHGLPFWEISNRLMIRLRGAARLLKYDFSRANSAWGYSQPFHTSG